MRGAEGVCPKGLEEGVYLVGGTIEALVFRCLFCLNVGLWAVNGF